MKTDLLGLNKLSIDYIAFNTTVMLEQSVHVHHTVAKPHSSPLIANLPVIPFEQTKNVVVNIFVAEHTIASITNLNGNSLSLRVDPNHILGHINFNFINENSPFISVEEDFSHNQHALENQTGNFSGLLINHLNWDQAKSYILKVSWEENDFQIQDRTQNIVDQALHEVVTRAQPISGVQEVNISPFIANTISPQVETNLILPVKDPTIKPNEEYALNHAPTATLTAPQVINEDALLSYNASKHFSDNDLGDHLTFKAKLVDGSDLPSWLSINEKTGVISGAPTNENVGMVSVRLTATDSLGLSISTDLMITVNNTNDAPTVVPITDTSIHEDSALNYNVSGQFADVDAGDSLTYSLANGAPAWVHIDASTGVITGTPANGDVGIANITVIATDHSGAAVQDTFQITVNNTNDAPTVTPLPNV